MAGAATRGRCDIPFSELKLTLLGLGTWMDLLVEDTGDPEQLARRSAEVKGLPVAHVSCHGHNNHRVRPDGPHVPVLMMEKTRLVRIVRPPSRRWSGC